MFLGLSMLSAVSAGFLMADLNVLSSFFFSFLAESQMYILLLTFERVELAKYILN